MKLAIVGPFPPAPTGIADYSAVLVKYLRQHFESIAVVTDRATLAYPVAEGVDEYYSAADSKWWQGGRVVPLYHMGNNARFHGYVYDLLRKFPGFTVLHDGNLLPFVHAETLEQGRRSGYVREISYELGNGHRRAWDALRGGLPLDPDDTPMLTRVTETSLGLVVHSDYLRDRIHQFNDRAKVAVIPHLDITPASTLVVSSERAKHSLGFREDDIVVGVLGFIAPSKRLEVVLPALRRLVRHFPDLKLVCVGKIVPGYGIRSLVEQLDLEDYVRFTGYVPLEELQMYVQAVDVGINLRHPTWGESSGTLMRLMAAGKPVIVTDRGAYSDLPDGVARRLEPDSDEIETLIGFLTELLSARAIRAEIGEAARSYVSGFCSPEAVALQYAGFIQTSVRELFA